MAYCTVTLVGYMSQIPKELIGFTTQAAYDTHVGTTLIFQAESFIDTYCGGRDPINYSGTMRRFNTNTGTLDLDGNGHSVLWFPPPYTPIRTVVSATLNGGAITPANIKVHTQYIEWDGGVFTEGKKNVNVAFTRGYATVPSDIQFVTAELCANTLMDMARRNTAEDVASVGPGRLDFTTLFGSPAIFGSPSIFTKDMKERLENYRITWVELG